MTLSIDIIEAKSMAATAMTSYSAAAAAAANTKRQELRAKEHLEPARTAKKS